MQSRTTRGRSIPSWHLERSVAKLMETPKIGYPRARTSSMLQDSSCWVCLLFLSFLSFLSDLSFLSFSLRSLSFFFCSFSSWWRSFSRSFSLSFTLCGVSSSPPFVSLSRDFSRFSLLFELVNLKVLDFFDLDGLLKGRALWRVIVMEFFFFFAYFVSSSSSGELSPSSAA